ncbi:MAG: cytochrome P450 [Gammaproteobacteria bacterium]|nr:cytochrome P450 [Gammaproteobacteria bacterium]
MADQIQEINTTSSNKTEAIPTLTGGWPVLGHLKEFQTDPLALLLRGYEQCGDLFRFRIGPYDFVLFSGMEAHEAYFKAPEDQLDPKSVYQFTVPIFGRGVAYDVAPEVMTEQLGFLFPALRESAMRRYVAIMYEEASTFADVMGSEGVLDVPVAMNQLTVNIASRCFLGEEIRREVDEEFAEAYHQLQNGINTIGFFFPRIPIPAHRRRDRARRQITEIFTRIMEEHRTSDSDSESFMKTLMSARYKDGRELTVDEITGITLTALFAGQHTSAVLATWMGLELARDENYINRIRQEMREIYEEDGGMSFAGLKRQQLIENAVRESERLHPPLILLIRKVLRPMTYRNRVVPANTMAVVSPAVSHRLAHLFSEPDRFNPDRFAPPANEDLQGLIGFGGGKHRCMGKNFAILQIKALWSVLLDRFEFSLDMPFPSPNYGSWVTGPKLPCLLRYRSRSQQSVFR